MNSSPLLAELLCELLELARPQFEKTRYARPTETYMPAERPVDDDYGIGLQRRIP